MMRLGKYIMSLRLMRITKINDEMQNIIKAFNKLNPVDKIIIELYAETKSQRKTADILGVSRTTLIKVMNNIREKIIKNL